MARSLKVADREKTAERLLNSSADKFYDPEVDIDWAAPLASGLALRGWSFLMACGRR